MFTGLVEAIGTIDRVTENDAGRELRVRCPWVDLRLGESISLNGACLTVRTTDAGWFTVAAVTHDARANDDRLLGRRHRREPRARDEARRTTGRTPGAGTRRRRRYRAGRPTARQRAAVRHRRAAGSGAVPRPPRFSHGRRCQPDRERPARAGHAPGLDHRVDRAPHHVRSTPGRATGYTSRPTSSASTCKRLLTPYPKRRQQQEQEPGEECGLRLSLRPSGLSVVRSRLPGRSCLLHHSLARIQSWLLAP